MKLYLSSDSEKALAVGVHKNEFNLVTGVGAVRVNTEDQLTSAVINSEAVVLEKQRGFKNGEMGFLFVYILVGHQHRSLISFHYYL